MTASLPPGKLGAPWIGETLSIARNNHKFYKDHFAKYGPIFKTRLFGINFVIVSGHEAFHQFATDPRVEEAGTINVPDVVGLRGRANQRRAMGETAPPKASGAEVFQASGGAENGVAPTVERREAIG